MDLQACAQCGVLVTPSADGTCPNCRQRFHAMHDATTAQAASSTVSAKLLVPAILLTIIAALGALNSVYVMVTPERPVEKLFDDPGMQAAAERGRIVGRMAGSPIVLIINLIMLAGGVAMLRQQHRGVAITAAILAMLPCSIITCLGFPVGIWSVVVLNQSDVKSVFR